MKKRCVFIKHGYYAELKENNRKVNAMDEHCCLRNNWRKYNKLSLLRKAHIYMKQN